MADNTDKLPPKKAERQARLAEALRDNLKRRKAQARERAAEDPANLAPDEPMT